jgi:hypothetical protein
MKRATYYGQRSILSRTLLSLLLVLFASISAPHAQAGRAKAGLQGGILDPDGKAVQGAIVIRNEATGEITTTTT